MAKRLPGHGTIEPLRLSTRTTVARRLFVRDLVLPCEIGVYAHERGKRQRVRINVRLDIRDAAAPFGDHISDVVSYEHVVDQIRTIVDSGHLNLVETLAQRIADLCLDDRRVDRAWVRVEKLDVIADAGGVGVEIERVAEN